MTSAGPQHSVSTSALPALPATPLAGVLRPRAPFRSYGDEPFPAGCPTPKCHFLRTPSPCGFSTLCASLVSSGSVCVFCVPDSGCLLPGSRLDAAPLVRSLAHAKRPVSTLSLMEKLWKASPYLLKIVCFYSCSFCSCMRTHAGTHTYVTHTCKRVPVEDRRGYR